MRKPATTCVALPPHQQRVCSASNNLHAPITQAGSAYVMRPAGHSRAHCWLTSPPAPRMRSLSPATLGLWSRVSRSARLPLPLMVQLRQPGRSHLCSVCPA